MLRKDRREVKCAQECGEAEAGERRKARERESECKMNGSLVIADNVYYYISFSNT